MKQVGHIEIPEVQAVIVATNEVDQLLMRANETMRRLMLAHDDLPRVSNRTTDNILLRQSQAKEIRRISNEIARLRDRVTEYADLIEEMHEA